MQKEFKKTEARLERQAVERAEAIRRVVREYHESVQKSDDIDMALKLKKQREIERVVADYIRLQKALKRLRRKS